MLTKSLMLVILIFSLPSNANEACGNLLELILSRISPKLNYLKTKKKLNPNNKFEYHFNKILSGLSPWNDEPNKTEISIALDEYVRVFQDFQVAIKLALEAEEVEEIARANAMFFQSYQNSEKLLLSAKLGISIEEILLLERFYLMGQAQSSFSRKIYSLAGVLVDGDVVIPYSPIVLPSKFRWNRLATRLMGRFHLTLQFLQEFSFEIGAMFFEDIIATNPNFLLFDVPFDLIKHEWVHWKFMSLRKTLQHRLYNFTAKSINGNNLSKVAGIDAYQQFFSAEEMTAHFAQVQHWERTQHYLGIQDDRNLSNKINGVLQRLDQHFEAISLQLRRSLDGPEITFEINPRPFSLSWDSEGVRYTYYLSAEDLATLGVEISGNIPIIRERLKDFMDITENQSKVIQMLRDSVEASLNHLPSE